MKSYIKIIVLAIFIGGLFAFIFYKDIRNDVSDITNSKDIVHIFQIGAYEDMNNAVIKKKEYTSSSLFYDNGLYRVIASVCYNDNTCNLLKNYFDRNNINYYLKKYTVNINFIQELINYEKIINNTTSNETIDKINNKINSIFISYL